LAKRKDKAVGAQPAASAPSGRETIRLDKWLFYARFFKTRVLASTVISKGRVRINGQRQSKPGHAIGPGDVLTFPMGDQARVIRVLAPGTRRGPASEAQALYLDLDPPRSEDPASNAADPASPLE
jgi:ribosome-associated heat shock protein Hsp15